MKVRIEFDSEMPGRNFKLLINNKKVTAITSLKLLADLEKNVFDFFLKGRKLPPKGYTNPLRKTLTNFPLLVRLRGELIGAPINSMRAYSELRANLE